MNCRSVESRLSAYLDGELTGQEMFCIREHLSKCCACREEADSLKRLKSLIGSMECPEPPCDFESRLKAAVAVSSEPKSSFSGLHSVLLFAGVAGVTMLVTLQVLGTAGHSNSVPVTPMASQPGPGIDFEVKRDAMTSAISDPISGGPAWSAADSR